MITAIAFVVGLGVGSIAASYFLDIYHQRTRERAEEYFDELVTLRLWRAAFGYSQERDQ